MSTTPKYTVRFQSVDMLEREFGGVLCAPVYYAGRLVEPDSASAEIFDKDGTQIGGTYVATITECVPYITVPAGDLSGYTCREDTIIQWTITITDADQVPQTVTIHPRNMLYLVKCLPYPVVTDADMYRKHPDLCDYRETYQDQIDEAWIQLNSDLCNMGNRAHMILTPAQLREPHLLRALGNAFASFDQYIGTEENSYRMLAKDYAKKYHEAMDSLSIVYDTDDDGKIECDDEKVKARRSIYLTVPKNRWRRYGR